MLLRIGFTVAPIAFGADKFANTLVNWEPYLAPWIWALSPLSAMQAMRIVGVVEILAGIAVAIKPGYGAYIIAAWLAGIIINLLSYSGYYDIGLRDLGLMIGALARARLASRGDRPAPPCGPTISQSMRGAWEGIGRSSVLSQDNPKLVWEAK